MHGHIKGVRGFGSLLELGNALGVVDGLLTLSDDELKERLAEVHSILSFDAVRTYSELVKAVVEFTAGCVAVTLSATGLIARAAGDSATAAVLRGASRAIGTTVATVISVIELAGDAATMLSPSATRQEKLDHGAHLVSTAAWLASKGGERAALGGASVAVMLGYEEAKLAANLYWGASQGLVAGLMAPAFKQLRMDADAIAGATERVIKARAILETEKDPEQQAALRRVLERRSDDLGDYIDKLISDLAAPDFEAGMATHPGAYKILVDALSVVHAFKGCRTPELTLTGAAVALSRLTWVFANQEMIELAATTHGTLHDAEKLAARRNTSEGKKNE